MICRRSWIHISRSRCQAFTLLELLLVIFLFLIFTSAWVINFSPLQHGAELNEGRRHFDTLLRFARAHAAQTGRKVQLTFTPPEPSDIASTGGASIALTWEPDPLASPGAFSNLTHVAWGQDKLNELISVASVRLGNASQPDAAEWEPLPELEPTALLPPVTFYPDGSSDSAIIEITSRNAEDLRRCRIQLTGAIATLAYEWISTEADLLASDNLEEALSSEEGQSIFTVTNR